MLSGRDIFRIISFIVFSAGIICLPKGWPPPNPKSWTSNFTLLAGTGEFFAIGVILCVFGLLMIGLSYVPLPKKMKKRPNKSDPLTSLRLVADFKRSRNK